MSKAPAQPSALKTTAIILATFLVVGGIAGMALTVDRAKQPIAKLASENPVASTSTVLDAILLVDQSGATLESIDGSKSKKLAWPDDVSLLGKPLSQLRGAYIRGGQPAWLMSGFLLPTSTLYRSPDGRREVVLSDVKRDGSYSLQITYGRDTHSQALREKNRAIKNVGLVGWADDDSIVFTGMVTDTRAAYVADLNGAVTRLMNLPDESWSFSARSTAFYDARAAMGEGIESPQQPPSSVWQTMLNGKSQPLVETSDKVIQSFVPFNSSLLYAMDNGDLYLETASGTEALGLGFPLLLMSDRTAVWSWDDRLFIRNPSGTVKQLPFENPDAAVFFIPRVNFPNQ